MLLPSVFYVLIKVLTLFTAGVGLRGTKFRKTSQNLAGGIWFSELRALSPNSALTKQVGREVTAVRRSQEDYW